MAPESISAALHQDCHSIHLCNANVVILCLRCWFKLVVCDSETAKLPNNKLEKAWKGHSHEFDRIWRYGIIWALLCFKLCLVFFAHAWSYMITHLWLIYVYTVCVIRYKIIVDHFRPGKCTGHCVAIGPSEKGLYARGEISDTPGDAVGIPICFKKQPKTTDRTFSPFLSSSFPCPLLAQICSSIILGKVQKPGSLGPPK